MRHPSLAFIYSERVAGNFIKSNIIRSFPRRFSIPRAAAAAAGHLSVSIKPQ